jgi:hypothetical protein
VGLANLTSLCSIATFGLQVPRTALGQVYGDHEHYCTIKRCAFIALAMKDPCCCRTHHLLCDCTPNASGSGATPGS